LELLSLSLLMPSGMWSKDAFARLAGMPPKRAGDGIDLFHRGGVTHWITYHAATASLCGGTLHLLSAPVASHPAGLGGCKFEVAASDSLGCWRV
jgi:hypothetical protein